MKRFYFKKGCSISEGLTFKYNGILKRKDLFTLLKVTVHTLYDILDNVTVLTIRSQHIVSNAENAL
jgi:hypothetical protein